MSNYKCRITTDIDGKKWNDDLKKSNYSTFFQTYEFLKSNSLIGFFLHKINGYNRCWINSG